MDDTWITLYERAAAVRRERRISDYLSCGEVSAAVLSRSGKIYTGVCVDTCSTLGICAERSAIFQMLTDGEQEIDKVLAILPDGPQNLLEDADVSVTAIEGGAETLRVTFAHPCAQAHLRFTRPVRRVRFGELEASYVNMDGLCTLALPEAGTYEFVF